MLWPYQRGSAARDHARLDGWIPKGAWMLEHHAIDVPSSAEDAFAAISAVRVRDLPIMRVLFALRGRRAPVSGGDTTLKEFFSAAPFLLLEEEQGRELVSAVTGPSGRGSRPASVPRTPDEVRDALEAGRVTAVANVRADPVPGGSRVWTETWVYAPTPGRRAAFTAYWLAIGPFSAWIRRMVLRIGRAGAERRGGRNDLPPSAMHSTR